MAKGLSMRAILSWDLHHKFYHTRSIQSNPCNYHRLQRRKKDTKLLVHANQVKHLCQITSQRPCWCTEQCIKMSFGNLALLLHAKLARPFSIVLYTKMAVSSRGCKTKNIFHHLDLTKGRVSFLYLGKVDNCNHPLVALHQCRVLHHI